MVKSRVLACVRVAELKAESSPCNRNLVKTERIGGTVLNVSRLDFQYVHLLAKERSMAADIYTRNPLLYHRWDTASSS
jgi:hypothetical protein